MELMSSFSTGLSPVYPIPSYYNRYYNLPSRWLSPYLRCPSYCESHRVLSVALCAQPLHQITLQIASELLLQSRRWHPSSGAYVLACPLTKKTWYLWLFLFLCGKIPPLFLAFLSHCVKNSIFFACFYTFGLQFKCQWPTEKQVLD